MKILADQEGVSPYVGPRPFEQNIQDRNRFFGRNKENRQIFSLILAQSSTVLVYAKSGSWKNVFIQYSLVSTLEKEGFDVLPLARVQSIVPDSINTTEIKNIYVFNALQSLRPRRATRAYSWKRLL